MGLLVLGAPEWCARPSPAVAAATAALPIDVAAPAGVSDALVRDLCAEAAAIWGAAGVTLDCRRAAAASPAGEGLLVTIVEANAGAASDEAMGWITFDADGPARAIYLSRGTAEALLRRTPGLNDATIAAHEILLGRALGRALAHELGHYLLRSKAHTRDGLMRAARTGLDFFEFDRRGFQLTRDQRMTACADSPGQPIDEGILAAALDISLVEVLA